MLFNSYIFILFFLPVTLCLYYGLNHFRREGLAKLALIVMSVWFYAYFHVSYVAIILLSVLANYACSRALLKTESPALRKGILSAGIAGNIGVIFYFKYFNFLLENINYVLQASFEWKNILMPLDLTIYGERRL